MSGPVPVRGRAPVPPPRKVNGWELRVINRTAGVMTSPAGAVVNVIFDPTTGISRTIPSAASVFNQEAHEVLCSMLTRR